MSETKKIRTKFDTKYGAQLGGWLDGKMTYLGVWRGDDGNGGCLGHVQGYKLYRLAKAIVRHWEDSNATP